MSTSTKIPLLTVLGGPVSFESESEPDRRPLAKTDPVEPSAQVRALLAEKLVAACEPLNFCLSTVAARAPRPRLVTASVAVRTRAVFICMGGSWCEVGSAFLHRTRGALLGFDRT